MMITVDRGSHSHRQVGHARVTGVLIACLAFSSPSSAGESIRLDGATVEACFTPGANCASIVADAVLAARERVWLLGYGFSEPGILGALKEVRGRGLDVRLILDRSNDDGGRNSGATYMAKLGVPVLIDRSVRIAHNKLILIDRDTVIMGSLNWTTAGNTKNAENVHIFRGTKELSERHAAYFRGREAVSEPYKLKPSGATSR